MSILEVKNLSHGFGDRAIFEDVSFRLLKGEHIGLVGANGEGKSMGKAREYLRHFAKISKIAAEGLLLLPVSIGS